jgi:hypothetical protein
VSTDEQYEALLDGSPAWDTHLRVVSPKVWQRLVLMRDQGCVLKGQGPCEEPYEAHHLLTQQQLRKRGLSDVAYDVRNGMGLCNRHHRRHTRAVERIPFAVLPERAHEFAAELGLGWLLDRYYPKEAAA